VIHRHRRSALRGAAVGAAMALLASCVPAAAASASPASGEPVRFVVTLSGAAVSKAKLLRTTGSLDVRSVRSLGNGVASVTVVTDDAESAARHLDASRYVLGATEDRRFTRMGAKAPVRSSDPYFGKQWDLWDTRSTARAGGFGTDAARAWQVTTGSSDVVVAVLDTGITPHPDLDGASIAGGYDFVSDEDGVDPGDGGGWDDDPTDEGDACLDLGETASWHGTFVAGEIVAQQNGSGVVGQARGVTLLPVRVLGACGGSEADTIAAIQWSTGGAVPGVPANPTPARIVSMSLGSADGACSDALQTAIDDARSRGAVVIAAAGNDGTPMSTTSPANCDGVISVSATTRTGGLASYSNYGTAAMSPTIAAPGGSPQDPIVGDTWTSTTTLTASRNRPSIGVSEGTSMATPRVSAAVALLLSVEPGLDPDDIAARLVATATPFASRSRCSALRCGPGIVNAGDLVGAPKAFVQASATTVSGAAKPGKVLKANAGTWREKPQRIGYQWLRDGKPVAGATARTYRVAAKDAGHRIGVQVQVQRDGTTTATARSAARRVAR
jgi:serine protease